MVSRLLSERSVYQCSAFLVGVVFLLLLTDTSAMAADVTALFQEARTTATQLNRHAATMESFTRSNLNWKSRGAQMTRIKDRVNKAGSILAQMQAARGDAKPWHQDAIDRITPTLKQVACNTESIINHLNENPKHLTNPTYVQYLRSNAQSASELAAAVGNVADYDRTRTKMEDLQAK